MNRSALAAEFDDARVGQQQAAGLCLEARADEEVAVAVHQIKRATAGAVCLERIDDAAIEVRFIVVAGPVFEKVAKDVERFCLQRRSAQKIKKNARQRGARRAEMQIGNEKTVRHTGMSVVDRGCGAI